MSPTCIHKSNTHSSSHRLFPVAAPEQPSRRACGASVTAGRATGGNSCCASMVLHIVSRHDLLQREGPSVFSQKPHRNREATVQKRNGRELITTPPTPPHTHTQRIQRVKKRKFTQLLLILRLRKRFPCRSVSFIPAYSNLSITDCLQLLKIHLYSANQTNVKMLKSKTTTCKNLYQQFSPL